MRHIKQLVQTSKEIQKIRNEIQSEIKGIRDGFTTFEGPVDGGHSDIDFYKGQLQALEYVIALINKL